VEKSERLTFPPRLEIRQKSPDFHIPTAPTATLTSQLPKRLHILCGPTSGKRKQRPVSNFQFRLSGFGSSGQSGIVEASATVILLISKYIPALNVIFQFPISSFRLCQSGIESRAPFIFLEKPAFFLCKRLK